MFYARRGCFCQSNPFPKRYLALKLFKLTQNRINFVPNGVTMLDAWRGFIVGDAFDDTELHVFTQTLVEHFVVKPSILRTIHRAD